MTASLATPARRVRTRAVAAAAFAAGAALVLSACSAGQISQTATQVASINGNGANQANISLRNVHIAFPNSEEYSLEPGGKAELLFTAINTSETIEDRLEGIETDAADRVVLVGSTGGIDIPAQAAVAAGAPAEQQPADPDEPSTSILVELEGLTEDVRPGLTVPFTFAFAEAGDVTVQVPVDAGPTPRVVDELSGAETHSEGSH